MNVWLAFYFITRGSCVEVPGLPWLKKYLFVMSSNADEQHASCMVVDVWFYNSAQRFVSKFDIVDGSFLPNLLHLYRSMYVRPLTISIVSPLKQTFYKYFVQSFSRRLTDFKDVYQSQRFECYHLHEMYAWSVSPGFSYADICCQSNLLRGVWTC